MSKKIIWNKVTWYSQAVAIVLFLAVLALGFYIGLRYNEAGYDTALLTQDDLTAGAGKWHKHTFTFAPSVQATTTAHVVIKQKPTASTTTSTEVPKTPPAPVTTPTPTPAPTAAPGEVRISAYLTAYTYWDNTPPGSADISNPIIHQKAGGTGTFADPITLAVGHSYATGKDVLDYPAGTKFYMPYLKRYFIVEDTCGDGAHPENGPCHTGYQGHPWLDMWIDGALGTRSSSNTCAEDITEIHAVIKNPAANYAVVAGPVFNTSCAQQFSDTPVTTI
jgi:hypothetical protein